MGRVASSIENSLIESYWSTGQRELLDRASEGTRMQLWSAMFKWIAGFWNPRPRHASLCDVSAADYSALHTATEIRHDYRAKTVRETG